MSCLPENSGSLGRPDDLAAVYWKFMEVVAMDTNSHFSCKHNRCPFVCHSVMTKYCVQVWSTGLTVASPNHRELTACPNTEIHVPAVRGYFGMLYGCMIPPRRIIDGRPAESDNHLDIIGSNF